MSKFISKFINDEAGATAIEYGLIVALIAVVVITAFTTLGSNLNGKMTTDVLRALLVKAQNGGQSYDSLARQFLGSSSSDQG